MIPKIIHYCWFGNSSKGTLAETCIQSWRNFFPEYRFIEWNEKNIDVSNEIPYVRQAYQEKKYAFVSDYIRLKALYEYGGIYFDTDYEVIRSFKDVLADADLITGFESKNSILTAMIACNKGNKIIKEFLDQYEERNFIREDGSFDITPINVGFSRILEKYGVDLCQNTLQKKEKEFLIYPIEVLCGFDVEYWHERITDNTHGIHHMSNSWATPAMRTHIKRIKFLQKILGFKNYDKLKNLIKKI